MLNEKTLRIQKVSRRTFVIGVCKLGLLSILGIRMFYMQCIKRNEYKTLSEKNRITLVLIPPNRGQIFDRNNILLATNKPCFRLLLDKYHKKNYQEEIEFLSTILQLDDEILSHIQNKIKKSNRRMSITILDQLSWQQISTIEEYKHRFSSLFIDMGYARFYNTGVSCAHLIGYVGQVSEREAKESPNSNRDFSIGKSGIEKYYEDTLCGEFGYKQLEVNAFGKCIRELKNVVSKPGNNINLNIDGELQTAIQQYLNIYGCSAVVMDCTNGEILIFAVSPSFDPNNFIKLSKDYWYSIINDTYKPLINKVTQSHYPPGSVFKIITVLAALEAGIKPDRLVNCTGGPALKNGFHCSSHTGHGNLNMTGALKYSCNSYIYEIAKLIGHDRIINMAKKFGFGTITGIDIPNEIAGFVPSKKWKKDKLGFDWTLGDTLNLSIGQGFLLATPMQLVRFCAAIANNGKLYKPRIAKSNLDFEQIDIPQEHFDILKDGMYKAVNEIGGTAYHSKVSGESYVLAGKTGTSQVQAKASAGDDLNRESIAWEKRNHASFIGFAPYDNPKYAIAVFVDHGGSGGRAAAPIASNIIQAIFKKYG